VTASPPSCSWSTTAVPSFVSIVTGSGHRHRDGAVLIHGKCWHDVSNRFADDRGTDEHDYAAGPRLHRSHADPAVRNIAEQRRAVSTFPFRFRPAVTGTRRSIRNRHRSSPSPLAREPVPATAVFAITANPSTTSTRPGIVRINGVAVNVTQAARRAPLPR
jgi:hypothetical protein